jgi:hypothetical protein
MPIDESIAFVPSNIALLTGSDARTASALQPGQHPAKADGAISLTDLLR